MTVATWVARLAVFALCAGSAACAGRIAPPRTAPLNLGRDAVLILPGFGYSNSGERVLRSLSVPMAAQGFDLYVPTTLSRGGLEKSRSQLQRFIQDHQLARYQRLHVFAFIAGAWTFNPLMDAQRLPNLATVVYDRSPLQERAPKIADDKLHFLAWLRYGAPVFDLARTPYPPLNADGVKVGMMIETVPTPFIRKREEATRSYGPLRFECDAMAQRYDDCIYVAMSHDELYRRFAEVWPELLAFIRDGRFTNAADRTPPSADPFAAARPRSED